MTIDANSPGEVAATLVDDFTTQIASLPEVAYLEATEEGGAPESNWGNLFFYAGTDRVRPFATIVLRDMPGWDEESDLDRPGVFRLNFDLGREEFQQQFGFPPAKFKDHRSGFNFAQLDQLLPHPAYGQQAWACILNPSPGRQDIDQLIRHAHQRALRHAHRRQHP